jgi:hypothetical protein
MGRKETTSWTANNHSTNHWHTEVIKWEEALHCGYSVRQMFEQTAVAGDEPLRAR